MNFLKLVNVPLSMMNAEKYGAATGKSKIPYEECGISKVAISVKSIQYTDFNSGDQYTYLPISDDELFNSKFSIKNSLKYYSPNNIFVKKLRTEKDFLLYSERKRLPTPEINPSE